MVMLKLSLAFGLMVTMNHWSHACEMWYADQSSTYMYDSVTVRSYKPCI